MLFMIGTYALKQYTFLFNQGQVEDGIAEISVQISTLITQALSRFVILKDTWSDYIRIQPVEKNVQDW
jgi:hypothetical protein